MKFMTHITSNLVFVFKDMVITCILMLYFLNLFNFIILQMTWFAFTFRLSVFLRRVPYSFYYFFWELFDNCFRHESLTREMFWFLILSWIGDFYYFEIRFIQTSPQFLTTLKIVIICQKYLMPEYFSFIYF